jgi:hypothetical protein
MKTVLHMDGEDLIEEELTNIEVIDMILGVVEVSPSNLDLNVDPILDVDDQPPSIVKLSDMRHHPSMLSHFFLNNLVNFSVHDVTNSKKYWKNLTRWVLPTSISNNRQIYILISCHHKDICFIFS